MPKKKPVRHSRKATGDTVQLSTGEIAKLHANYAGDKVFAKGAVTEGYRKAANFWREEHGKAVERNKRLNELKYEPFHHLRWWFICAKAAIKTPPTAPTGSCRGLCF